MRSLQAAQRRAERDALKRQNELKRQQKQLEKMRESERASYEVQVYENYLDVLLSVHKESGNQWEWESIHSSDTPDKPTKNNSLELEAQAQLDEGCASS